MLPGGNILVAQAYVADVTTPENRSRGMGLIGMAFGLGFVLGPLLGGLVLALPLEDSLRLKLPFLVAAGFSTLAWILVLTRLPEPAPAGSAARPTARVVSWRGIVDTLTLPDVGALVALGALVVLAFAALEGTFSLYLRDRMQWDARSAAFGFAFLGFVSAFVQGGLIRRLVPRFGEPRLFAIGIVLLALGFVALASVASGGALIGRDPPRRSRPGSRESHDLGPPVAHHARTGTGGGLRRPLLSANPGPNGELPGRQPPARANRLLRPLLGSRPDRCAGARHRNLGRIPPSRETAAKARARRLTARRPLAVPQRAQRGGCRGCVSCPVPPNPDRVDCPALHAMRRPRICWPSPMITVRPALFVRPNACLLLPRSLRGRRGSLQGRFLMGFRRGLGGRGSCRASSILPGDARLGRSLALPRRTKRPWRAPVERLSTFAEVW